MSNQTSTNPAEGHALERAVEVPPQRALRPTQAIVFGSVAVTSLCVAFAIYNLMPTTHLIDAVGWMLIALIPASAGVAARKYDRALQERRRLALATQSTASEPRKG